MKYLTGYVWQNPQLFFGEQKLPRESSVLLQQMSCGKSNVLLACVCEGGMVGGYLTDGLRTWLADCGKELVLKKAENHLIKRELGRELSRLYQEAERYCERKNLGRAKRISLSGILIVDQECWLLQGGESCLMLLNRRFQRTHCKYIKNKEVDSVKIMEAEIEKSVGVLLGNPAFLQQISKETFMQCLAPQDIFKEAQIDRRLAEMAEESRRQGYMQECSAVYIRSM